MTETINRNAKFLIIDDQDANLLLMERILKQGGYTHYRSLSDSRQAVSAYQEYQPDLVLLDLTMPHLDGVAVMDQLRPLTGETYLPILVLTADVTVDAKRRALAAGAKDFLTKPLDAVEVLLRITNLLETRFLYVKLQSWANKRIQEQANLLDQANDAIIDLDLNDRILFWNHGAERLYGWTASEARGRNALDLLYKGTADTLKQAKQIVACEGIWAGELRQATRNRREISVASRWTLVNDEQGRPTSLLTINTDITENKHLEAQLIQAQRLEAVGRLAGGIAHDFNNLLTVIIGFSEMALGGLHHTEPTHDLIQQVRQAGNRAASLTRQLLAFSRKQVLAPAVLNLNTLVSETERMLRRLIGEDIALTTVLDPALGQVKADPGQLEQVLMNLVVNARDAMPTGGTLCIRTENLDVEAGSTRASAEVKPGRWVTVSVTDNGSGMDEATLARIFEPFFTTKEVGKGTGLGLSTVYGIVKQSEGAVEVESKMGGGTTFRICLPRLAQEETISGTSQPGLKVIPSGTGTVLLVEDEERVRVLSSMALRTAGYHVIEAEDGEEALKICEQHKEPIDLLVTDVVMPKMNGRQLADRLVPLRPNLKVLFMSGYTDDTVVRHGVKEAGLAFLQKPFTPSVLVRKAREVLGH